MIGAGRVHESRIAELNLTNNIVLASCRIILLDFGGTVDDIESALSSTLSGSLCVEAGTGTTESKESNKDTKEAG